MAVSAPGALAPDAPSILPSAQDAIARVTRYTQIVAGVTVFGIAAGSLVSTHGWRPPGADLLAFAIPLVAWLASWAIRTDRSRARLQLIAFALIATAPWWLPPAGTTPGASWIPAGEVTFAVIIVAIMSWPRNLALVIVFLTAAFQVLSTAVPPPAPLLVEPVPAGVGDWAPVLYIVIVGTGLALWRQRWLVFAVASDAAFDDSERAVASALATYTEAEARVTAGRWIHENALNTILAVSKGIRPESVPLLQELSAQALDQTPRVEITALTLPEVLDRACAEAAIQTSIHRHPVPDVDVSREVAPVLRDAVFEALRNVDRHAAATQVQIVTEVSADRARVLVRDDGVGFDQMAATGFGLSVVLARSLAAVGGRGDVDSLPGRGTLVTLDIPLVALPPVPEPMPLSDQALGRVSSRLMAISPLLYGVIVAVLTIADEPRSIGEVLLRTLFMAAVLTNAIWWRRPVGRAAGYLSVVVLAGLFAQLALSSTPGLVTCSTATAYGYLADGGLGALLVVTLGLGRKPQFLALGVALTVIGAWSAVTLGPACSTSALESLVGTLTYLVLVLIAVRSIFRAADTRRRAALADWLQAERERQNTASLLEYHRAFDAVPASARTFLADIAAGRIDPTTELSRDRAKVEAAEIRAYLAQATPPGPVPLP